MTKNLLKTFHPSPYLTAFSLTHSLSLSLTRAHTHTHSPYQSLQLRSSHSLSLTTHTFLCALSHPFFHNHVLLISLSHIHNLSLSLSLSPSHSHIHTTSFTLGLSALVGECWVEPSEVKMCESQTNSESCLSIQNKMISVLKSQLIIHAAAISLY